MSDVVRVTLRVDADVLAQLDAYAAKHDLDRTAAIRLAILEQVKRRPPKEKPAGIVKPRGNPNIGELSQAGIEARRRKKGEQP